MLKNKNRLMILAAAVVILALGVCVALQFSAIKEVKSSNINSQNMIDKLNEQVDSLNSALADATNDAKKNQEELEKYEQELKKYEQEIKKHQNELDKYQNVLSAWSNASSRVREAIETITNSYGAIAENSHLYPETALKGLDTKMMDAVYCAIRSTTPDTVANDFAKDLEKLYSLRFDFVLAEKIDSVKLDGVLFPEDVDGYEDALAYYNSFANNPAVLNSFAEKNLDKELASIFQMLDADEENDLALVFIGEVYAVDLPLTLQTSLKNAMYAWDNLQNALEVDDTLNEETVKARALLDSYITHIEKLACPPHNCADCIRAKLNELFSAADEMTKQFLDEVAREIEAWLENLNIEEANRCLEEVITDLCPCPHN